MKYVVISEETLKNSEINKDHTLNAKELLTLSVHKDVIAKFIEQKAYSIQTELWQWKWKDKESICYDVMLQLLKIAWDIKDSENTLNKHHEKLKQKEQEENNLK